MTDRPTPGRPFGWVSATALVVANMIGAGIFTTSGFALADLGSRPRVMAAWLVGWIIALCGAVSYGGLVRRMAVSGGEYLFLSRVIHPGAGFLAGWVSLLAGFTGAIAFAATVFETYVVPESAPLASITLQVVLSAIVVSVSGLSALLSYLGFVLSMSAAGTVACLFVLRHREGKSVVAGIGYPLVPGIFIVATVTLGLLVATQRPREWFAAVVTLLSGLLAYRILNRGGKPD